MSHNWWQVNELNPDDYITREKVERLLDAIAPEEEKVLDAMARNRYTEAQIKLMLSKATVKRFEDIETNNVQYIMTVRTIDGQKAVTRVMVDWDMDRDAAKDPKMQAYILRDLIHSMTIFLEKQ